ncbi:MAG: hypothetical protein F6K28_61515 [Microcoleus sp. SIO2G3]|nr:hypothetical protein [Microcoleus sp. SIO2G3]
MQSTILSQPLDRGRDRSRLQAAPVHECMSAQSRRRDRALNSALFPIAIAIVPKADVDAVVSKRPCF